MRGKFLHTCAQCGGEEWLNRSGRFSEEDYLELFHEHMALQAQHRRMLDLLKVMRVFMALAKGPQSVRRVEESECPF